MKMINIKNLINIAVIQLENISTTPHLDAELLLCYVLRKERMYLFSHPEQTLSEQEYQYWQELLAKRLQKIPIAYLTQQKYFWTLDLYINEHVLIPRPETELLVEIIIRNSSGRIRSVLDLGTGSGAIALAIAQEQPHWQITAADISYEALKVAQKNAEKNNIRNVTFIQSDWLSSLTNKFDIIVSNPPYLDSSDPHLMREEIKHEPRSALVAEEGGFADIKKIISDARDYLQVNGGCLLIEHGCQQGERVRELFKYNGYQAVETFKDLAGLERVTSGVY